MGREIRVRERWRDLSDRENAEWCCLTYLQKRYIEARCLGYKRKEAYVMAGGKSKHGSVGAMQLERNGSGACGRLLARCLEITNKKYSKAVSEIETFGDGDSKEERRAKEQIRDLLYNEESEINRKIDRLAGKKSDIDKFISEHYEEDITLNRMPKPEVEEEELAGKSTREQIEYLKNKKLVNRLMEEISNMAETQTVAEAQRAKFLRDVRNGKIVNEKEIIRKNGAGEIIETRIERYKNVAERMKAQEQLVELYGLGKQLGAMEDEEKVDNITVKIMDVGEDAVKKALADSKGEISPLDFDKEEQEEKEDDVTVVFETNVEKIDMES